MRKQAGFLEHEAERRGGAVGTKSPLASSCQTSPPMANRPSAARSSPAMQRSSVVLPEPEGPNSAVTPRAGQAQVDRQREARRSTRKRARDFGTHAPTFVARRVEGVERQQDEEAESQHAAGQPVRLRVFERFDMVVDLHRDDPRLAGDVAADHQHDAEFADRVGEAQDRAAEKPGRASGTAT